MSIKVLVRRYEPVVMAVRRFKKIIERSGLMREVRRREHYIKPSQERRIAQARRKRALARLAKGD